MSLKRALCMKLASCVAIAALLLSGSLAAQITVLDPDEGRAILAQPNNGYGIPAQQTREQKRMEDPNAAMMDEIASDLDSNDISDNYDMNGLCVDIEMYIWNRISDLLDIIRCGIGGGVGIGAEVAITNYAVLGASYIPLERGVDFPHCLPPLWLINYYDKTPVFNIHATGEPTYATAAFGPWRKENVQADMKHNYIFPREEWAIRAEIHAILLDAYISVSGEEFVDFLAGFIGLDPKGDDDVADANVSRQPADQFGRGVCNIVFGIFEVPFNVLRITKQEGDLPGLSKGLAIGVWRFFVREVVGVVELVSFPFGWQPIIEPEYVFQRKRGVTWKVNRPAFHKKYNYRR